MSLMCWPYIEVKNTLRSSPLNNLSILQIEKQILGTKLDESNRCHGVIRKEYQLVIRTSQLGYGSDWTIQTLSLCIL